MNAALEGDLSRLLGADALVSGGRVRDYLHDSTEMQGLSGRADAVVAPASVEQVQKVVRFCYSRGIAMIPRGGGTGFAGGAVPDGGIVISLERVNSVRSFQPEYWRMSVDAGVLTEKIHRLARESGLFFPPDPGASEQSHIGGNIACNAGGPHSFKYGVLRDWVLGLEAVIAAGELVRFGGSSRKDVASYDLRSVMVGAEGTLGVITGAWLRLIPAPEAQLPLIAAYSSTADGVSALERIYGHGLQPAVLEFIDPGAMEASRAAFPWELPADANFIVITEADGSATATEELTVELQEALSESALRVWALREAGEQRQLRRWRSGVSFAVHARRGGKMSEDIAVPFDRLAEALALTEEAGRSVGLPTCCWGHAGDGNIHATFLIDANSTDEVERARRGAELLFAGAVRLGGTISGEHGLGIVKRDYLSLQLSTAEMRLQRALKRVFDPGMLFNPGKKVLAEAT